MALTADHLKRVFIRYHERLIRHREALNRLNVYPVPDGDTGTNMSLTVQSVVEEVGNAQGMEAVTGAIAHGSLMGARGNSGVILSQILRGLSDTFRGYEEVGTTELVRALDRASDAAYQAVLRPVEGTILTVLRAAADAAAETGTGAGVDLGALLASVYHRAEQELENTPELLPVLKQAGVVDAGAAGFLLLIVAFLEEVTGLDVIVPERIFNGGIQTARMPEGSDSRPTIGGLRYEVMFLLDATEESIVPFGERWLELGDSIVVVGGDGTYNCHIHTDLPGPAIEAGIAAGRPHRLEITDLLDQPAAEVFHAEEVGAAALPEFADAPVAVVPVVAGRGLVEMFRGLGAQQVVTGGQTMNPSTLDLLSVVNQVHADTVILLPNNKNIVPVANQVTTLTDKRVLVVPTVTIPQGLAAMVAYFPANGDGSQLAASMQTAANEVKTGELTRAVRSSRTPIGEVAEGDWLGLADGDLHNVHENALTALTELLEYLVGEDAELVTIITGAVADPDVTAAARVWLAAHRPEVEIEFPNGDQPVYPYLISVE
ncbi:MAG TPA: DAK2 domain-containing protein [Acidimicrobiia bacterium]|nr:DAK2 domain-containing protein [Acidimicrobiia bacterium]